MRMITASALASRLSETIDDFAEANKVTPQQVLDALKYVHGAFERYCVETPANKLH